MTAQALLERKPVLPKVSVEFNHNKYLVTGAALAAAGLFLAHCPS